MKMPQRELREYGSEISERRPWPAEYQWPWEACHVAKVWLFRRYGG